MLRYNNVLMACQNRVLYYGPPHTINEFTVRTLQSYINSTASYLLDIPIRIITPY